MFFHRIFTPGLSINSYLLGDGKTKRCAVIDPTRHVVSYIVQAQNAGYEITDILETHIHADFISGARELKHQLNDKPCIYASGMGGKDRIPAYADEIVRDGFELKLGDLRLKALHTPGHTPEHLTWICFDDSRSSATPWFAFTGDCLFVGSVGRPDLLGKSETDQLAHQLYHTLFDCMAQFPDFLEIFPCHGEGSLCGKSLNTRSSSTLGFERLYNPFLKNEGVEKWVKKIEEEQLPAPSYFNHVKKINLSGPPLLSSLKVHKWGEEGGSPPLDQLFLLDIRQPEGFAASHLKKSINIPLSPTFVYWTGWMLPEKTAIGLVVENHHIVSEVIDQLHLMGFDQDIWIIELGANFSRIDYPLTHFSMIDPEDLAQRHPQFESIYLIDVRTPEEWGKEHIEGAHMIQLIDLDKALKQLPRHQSIALICKSGNRASLAASMLEKEGFSSVINVRGGMQAWEQAGLPIKKK